MLAIVVLLAYFLLRTRPFNTRPRCRGQESLTRIMGNPVYCRACRGTGFTTPSEQRKAALSGRQQYTWLPCTHGGDGTAASPTDGIRATPSATGVAVVLDHAARSHEEHMTTIPHGRDAAGGRPTDRSRTMPGTTGVRILLDRAAGPHEEHIGPTGISRNRRYCPARSARGAARRGERAVASVAGASRVRRLDPEVVGG